MSKVHGLGEIAVIQREPDLPLERLAIDDGSDGRELQAYDLIIVEGKVISSSLRRPDVLPETMSLSSGTLAMSTTPVWELRHSG